MANHTSQKTISLSLYFVDDYLPRTADTAYDELIFFVSIAGAIENAPVILIYFHSGLTYPRVVRASKVRLLMCVMSQSHRIVPLIVL